MSERRFHVMVTKRIGGRTVHRVLTPGGDAPYSDYHAADAAAMRAIQDGCHRARIECLSFDGEAWTLDSSITITPPRRGEREARAVTSTSPAGVPDAASV